MPPTHLHALDALILAAYLIAVLSIGYHSSRRQRAAAEYFAGRPARKPQSTHIPPSKSLCLTVGDCPTLRSTPSFPGVLKNHLPSLFPEAFKVPAVLFVQPCNVVQVIAT